MQAARHIPALEEFLNQQLVPLYSQCQILNDASVLICIHDPENHSCRLMIAGVSAQACQTAAHQQQLAQAIQADLLLLEPPAQAHSYRN